MACTTCATHWLIRGIITVAILPWATVQGADTAFMAVGDNGELSFSDIKSPDATEIPLTTFDTPTLSTDEHITQMLTVAQELAQARALREAQRAAAKAARLEKSALEEERDISSSPALTRNVYPHTSYYRNWPKRQHRQHPKQPVEERQDQTDSQKQLHSPLKLRR